jgi:hypothetical protein
MRPLLRVLAAAALFVPAPGCGPPAEKLVPVRGTVTLGGKPWSIGEVGFFPDAAKGNTIGKAAVGVIGVDGSYQLFTGGKAGAPPGWYKAVVWATKDPAAKGNPFGPDGKRRKIEWLIDPRYTDAETTPFTVEVVENPPPGHYELRVTK